MRPQDFVRLICILPIAAAAACGGDDAPSRGTLDGGLDGGSLGDECYEAAESASARLFGQPTLASIRSCTVDSECTLHQAPQIACPARNASFTECSIAIGTDKADTMTSLLATLEAELCPGAPRDCRASPSCPPTVARCIDGKCTEKVSDGGVGGP